MDVDHLRLWVPLILFDPYKMEVQSPNREDCLGCRWHVNVMPKVSDPAHKNCSVDMTLLSASQVPCRQLKGSSEGDFKVKPPAAGTHMHPACHSTAQK